MAWAEPLCSREEVNAAAKTILKESLSAASSAEALNVINNWRASHSFPLNTFQNGLRYRGRRIYQGIIVAQRVKRLISIEAKLRIRPTMKLTQMQDIGGCRAILDSVNQVRQVVDSYRHSDVRHKLLTCDDYISQPRASGYRGIHLVYSYYSDRKETYNGLKIEMQLRSQLQHTWATAVEVVGTMIRQALKSSQGDTDWLRFFQLMASEIARLEDQPIVDNTPLNSSDTRRELKNFVKSTNPVKRLSAYGSALKYFEQQENREHYFILRLSPLDNNLTISSYRRDESARANLEYLLVEKNLNKDAGEEAVLVSVDSVASLRKAYPNYFLDTQSFCALITQFAK